MKKTQFLNIFFLKIKNIWCVTDFCKKVSGLKIGMKELHFLNYWLKVYVSKIFSKTKIQNKKQKS